MHTVFEFGYGLNLFNVGNGENQGITFVSGCVGFKIDGQVGFEIDLGFWRKLSDIPGQSQQGFYRIIFRQRH